MAEKSLPECSQKKTGKEGYLAKDLWIGNGGRWIENGGRSGRIDGSLVPGNAVTRF